MSDSTARDVVFCGCGTSGRSELARTIRDSSHGTTIEQLPTRNVLVVDTDFGILRISTDMWLSKLHADDVSSLFSDERVRAEIEALEQAQVLVFLWDVRRFRNNANLNHLCRIGQVLNAVSRDSVRLLVLINLDTVDQTEAGMSQASILDQVEGLVTSRIDASLFTRVCFIVGGVSDERLAQRVIECAFEA